MAQLKKKEVAKGCEIVLWKSTPRIKKVAQDFEEVAIVFERETKDFDKVAQYFNKEDQDFDEVVHILINCTKTLKSLSTKSINFD